MQGATTLNDAEFTPVHWVMHLQWEASQSGKLPIWTVYDHPTDHPDCFVARQHLAGAPTINKLSTDNIEVLRMIFRHAGLVMIPRDPGDDAKIVESWI
jgi:hypothetical protein